MTFFDLNNLHDEYKDELGSFIEVDYYHANQLLPLSDDQIVELTQKDLASCIPAFGDANVVDRAVVRISQGVSHFAPGSYRYLLPGTTSFSNVFMSGDWIVTRHGSWSQEKAYVTGLEAANRVAHLLGTGIEAEIIPIVPDEPHIQTARIANRAVRQVMSQVIPQLWSY
ncbi:FAD-dependent oxidoreductase [Leptolyngbya ectocarpi]|uniref:FAD-dependent oxidoreductase n=1 Tax=Leptolyngbya ectocarpi TaxID=1202 RepID=UPI002AD53CE5|nr:FAD-dependent oxidoreductase [Leptolyngbya ectocarpi]